MHTLTFLPSFMFLRAVHSKLKALAVCDQSKFVFLSWSSQITLYNYGILMISWKFVTTFLARTRQVGPVYTSDYNEFRWGGKSLEDPSWSPCPECYRQMPSNHRCSTTSENASAHTASVTTDFLALGDVVLMPHPLRLLLQIKNSMGNMSWEP